MLIPGFDCDSTCFAPFPRARRVACVAWRAIGAALMGGCCAKCSELRKAQPGPGGIRPEDLEDEAAVVVKTVTRDFMLG